MGIIYRYIDDDKDLDPDSELGNQIKAYMRQIESVRNNVPLGDQNLNEMVSSMRQLVRSQGEMIQELRESNSQLQLVCFSLFHSAAMPL